MKINLALLNIILTALLLSCGDSMIEKGINSANPTLLQKVEITSHLNDDYVAGEITLSGRAINQQGIEVTDNNAFFWFSNIDGFLGNGIELVTTLTTGENRVTLQVIENSGARGEQTVNLIAGSVFTERFMANDHEVDLNREVTTAMVDLTNQACLLNPYNKYTLCSSFSGITTNDVAVSGNYAYVAIGAGGVIVLDITDPENPTQVASCNPPSGSASGIAISGNYAFLANGSAGLAVIDISVPAGVNDASLVASCDTAGSAVGIAISGNYAFIADYANGLVAIDITVPASVNIGSIVGSCSTDGSAVNIAISNDGNYAYVVDYDEFLAGGLGLVIVDISAPLGIDNTSRLGTYITSGSAFSVAAAEINGNPYAVIADGPGGILLIDTSDPNSPVEAGNFISSLFSMDITVSDTMAYVSGLYADNFQLIAVDISDPSSPYQIGSHTIEQHNTGDYSGIFTTNNHAFMTLSTEGLAIINLNKPLTRIGGGNELYIDDSINVSIYGDYAFLTGNIPSTVDTGLKIVNINPLSPTFLRTSASCVIDSAFGISVTNDGNYAYVAAFTNGIKIVDISDPENVSNGSIVNTYVTDGIAGAVTFSNDGAYAYLVEIDYDVSNNDRLVVLDISSPVNPASAGTCDVNGINSGVTISGNYAYAASGTDMTVIDISNPGNPSTVGTCDTGITANGVAIYELSSSEKYACVTNNDGMAVIDISDPESVDNTSLVTTYPLPGNSYGIEISGSYAYIAESGNGLTQIDLSDPDNPYVFDFHTLEGTGGADARSVAINGNYVYINDDNSEGLWIFQKGEKYINLFSDGIQSVQSNILDVNTNITKARIISTSTIDPTSGSIMFQVSNNGGADWHTAGDDVLINLPSSPDGTLLWRTYLQTSDIYQTPVLEDVMIQYWE